VVCEDRDVYNVYRSFTMIFQQQKYVTDMEIYCFRVAVSQARFNVLPINANVHRFSNIPLKKSCPFFRSAKEDEGHFLFECPTYSDLRTMFLKVGVAKTSVHVLLQMTNSKQMHSAFRYIFHAVNTRKKNMIGI